MIGKLTKGRSAQGGMRYDHREGKREKHENPHRVAGNVPGETWRARAHAIDEHWRGARPDAERPITRASLSLAKATDKNPEADRRLTDKEWRAITERYVREMGYDQGPWEATRHADDHVHITMSRVKWDGSLVSAHDDYRRSMQAVRGLEAEHGLIRAPDRARDPQQRTQITAAEISSADRRGVRPERDELRDRVRDAARASDGTWRSFERELSERGARVELRENARGPYGARFALDGHEARDQGADTSRPVWYSGSKLGKDLGWQGLSRTLDERAAQVQAEAAAAARAAEEQRRASLRAAGMSDRAIDDIDRLRATWGSPQDAARAGEQQQYRSRWAERDAERARADQDRDRGWER
jgi:hypothetical protein